MKPPIPLTLAVVVTVLGYVMTSTAPVEASPVYSAPVLEASGHEIRPQFICIDNSATALQGAATGVVGLAVGAASCGLVGAVGGWLVGTFGYAASHLVNVKDGESPEVLPPGVNVKHINALSEARLDKAR